MRQLGEVVLPDSTQWIDQNSWSPVAQETARTLGGSPIVWSHPLIGGRPITLDIQEGVTWLDQTTVDVIRTMATQPGANFTLIWDSEFYTVLFRHDAQPAVSFEPLWPNYDLYTGTIKLITV